MNKYKILFIDDEVNVDGSTRQDLIKTLNNDPRFEITAYHPKDFLEQLDTNTNLASDSTLIIVDYRLGANANTDGCHYNSNGYSLTSLCKEKFPDIPVYLISQILEDDITNSDHYDKMISHAFLTTEEGRSLLYADCASYHTLLSPHIDVQTLFDSPEADIDTLLNCFPAEFRDISNLNAHQEPQKVQDKERPKIRFAKWINQVFLVRSGPLIDEQELYVTFGLNPSENCIKELLPYKQEINQLQYKGIFSNAQRPRWWAQSIFNLASSSVKIENQMTPWKEIPENLNYPEDCIATCVVCRKKLPECIAYDSEDLTMRNGRPAHWKCTSPSVNHEDISGFNPVFILDDL